MPLSVREYLQHILDETDYLLKSSNDLDKATFSHDETLKRAYVRSIEIKRIKSYTMSRFIAFLRAINIGGGRTVKMDSLRQIFESLGFSRVTTFIASGNVVFETTTKNARTLERKIEKGLREALGYEVGALIGRRLDLRQGSQALYSL